MKKNFNLCYINELADEILKCNSTSYEDLPKYNLFVSQVVDYLNDNFTSDKFTTNIVQNYIKDEVITKPEDGKKRGYSTTHLIQLILLGYMRPLLTTEEIKKVFSLAFNEINDSSDDILSWEETYKTFIRIQKESLDDYLTSHLPHEDELDKIVNNFNLKDKDEDRIKILLLVLSLIAKASVTKKLVQKLINDYPNDYS